MVKFLRRTTNRLSKLGLRRKKKQVWRRPTGRHNKMRTKQKGTPATVSIGYGSKKDTRNKIREKIPVLVYSLKDLEKVKKENIIIIGKIGKKKKMELAKKIKEKNLEVYNVNVERLLKENKNGSN
jgi:ribosomal protein L32E